MINFDPSIPGITPKEKVENFFLVETLFSQARMATDPLSKKATGFEGDSSSTLKPEISQEWNSAIVAMNKVNLLGAAWNAVFSVAQQVPETFKKLMNG